MHIKPRKPAENQSCPTGTTVLRERSTRSLLTDLHVGICLRGGKEGRDEERKGNNVNRNKHRERQTTYTAAEVPIVPPIPSPTHFSTWTQKKERKAKSFRPFNYKGRKGNVRFRKKPKSRFFLPAQQKRS
mmetsp:Transcript_36897/g.72556  ORF Transcript_36897/g.72556 Transcript_36897/m.72556 type:complete len:130 (-) Transcript_36897:598-987(-)